jgi:hypothetical protein
VYAVKRNLDPLLETARETRATVNRILPYVEKDDVHHGLTDVVDDTRGLEGHIHDLLG